MQLKRIFIAAALVLGSLASNSAMANLVTNGDFEAGNTGWSTPGMWIYESSSYAHSGSWLAGTGCVGNACVSNAGTGAYLGQTLATDANSLYTLSFWVGEDSGATSEFSVFWNGVMVADVLNPANNTLNNGMGMVQYSFTNLLATGAATAFELHGRQDPAGIYFDDVSVVSANNVPEPSSLALIGLGLAGLAFSKRKKA